MKVIAVNAAVTDGHSFFHSCILWHFHRGNPPCDRQTRASQEREFHRARCVVHLFRPFPFPGEMLVIEDGHGLAAFAKYLDCFLKEAEAWVLHLPLRCLWIVAVLTYDND